jgi:hypothetical protein
MCYPDRVQIFLKVGEGDEITCATLTGSHILPSVGGGGWGERKAIHMDTRVFQYGGPEPSRPPINPLMRNVVCSCQLTVHKTKSKSITCLFSEYGWGLDQLNSQLWVRFDYGACLTMGPVRLRGRFDFWSASTQVGPTCSIYRHFTECGVIHMVAVLTRTIYSLFTDITK